MGIPPLRVALQTNTLTSSAIDRARPLSELQQVVFSQLEPMRRICDYLRISKLLPDVLDELHYHVVRPPDEGAQRLALEAMVEACAIAAVLAKGLGYADLAHVAGQRSSDAATLLDDPVQRGKADFMWLLTLPQASSWDRNLLAAERCASALEPHARDPLGKQVLGMIALTASMSAAAIQRGDRAEHWLSEARQLAAQVPDEPMRAWQSFSAANVSIWGYLSAWSAARPAARCLSWPLRLRLPCPNCAATKTERRQKTPRPTRRIARNGPLTW